MNHLSELVQSRLCRQFAAALLLCMIALSVVSAWFASGEAQDRALAAHRAKARAIVAMMDRVASARLAPNDFTTLAEQVIPGTDIKGGAVYDSKGQLAQAFGVMPGLSPLTYGGLTLSDGARVRLTGKNYDIVWRFVDKDRPYYIAVRTDVASLLRERYTTFAAALINALIAAFCTAFAFLAIALSYWGAPFLALERAISAGDGEAIDDALAKRDDEIGRLARAIRERLRERNASAAANRSKKGASASTRGAPRETRAD